MIMFRANLLLIFRAENSYRHMELCHTVVEILKLAVPFGGYYCQSSTLISRTEALL